jgi:hypothetical protein
MDQKNKTKPEGYLTREEHDKVKAKILAKVWTDEAYKARLFSNPIAAMREVGFEVPKGIEVQVVEETEKKWVVFLPPRPEGDLSEQQLEAVAGGVEPTQYHKADFSIWVKEGVIYHNDDFSIKA